jgi:hypothetical protein
MAPNLPLLPPLAGLLPAAEDPSEADRCDRAAPGVARHGLWREIIDPALGLRACMRLMAPRRIVLDDRRRLPIGHRAIGAASHRGREPSALDGKAPCGAIVPGVPPGHGRPADPQLWSAGVQRQQPPGMIADDGLRRAPLGDRLAADVDDAGEMLAVEPAGAHEGAAIAVEQEDAVEPVPPARDPIPDIDTPDLMRGRGAPGTFVGIRWACVPRGRMRTCIEGHPLPHGGVALARPQGIPGHLHPVVPEQRMMVQALEDLHHDLDRHARSHRCATHPNGKAPS